MRHLILGRAQSSHIQFFRYFFVGGTAAVVDLVVYTTLLKLLGIPYLVAAFIGYMIGLAWNHYLCVLWVFQSKHSRSKEVTMVIAIAIGGLIWTELILYGLVEWGGSDEIVAKIISQILVLLWNFGMRKMYVFH
ncbi:MAG: GtrA-like protein family [Candidatus Peregrinibacteria bacterium Greene0416_62]|nr:MAG: GtrA-like protein family [Candidatus Peregrinibacteria bacterium Greene0416_62]TSD00428.1 MAG: GtrA-like protein family [Candidatus Peregrinibacteria bacterium Greene1014_49]